MSGHFIRIVWDDGEISFYGPIDPDVFDMNEINDFFYTEGVLQVVNFIPQNAYVNSTDILTGKGK